jgi:hypothetical protein
MNDLIFFRYKAKLEGQLPFYDKTPLALIIDIRPTSLLCLNMHWIPPRLRVEFFNNIREIMSKTEKVGQQFQRKRMTYMLLRNKKFKIGKDAIRMYYVTGITKLQILPEAQWDILFGYGISQYKKRTVFKKNNYKD